MVGSSNDAQKGPVTFNQFLRFGMGGALGCSFTHIVVIPLDVVKTRLQTDPVKYNRGMIQGMKTIVKEEGSMMLLQGFGATAIGYSIQGFFKFGLYEVFKKKIGGLFSEEDAKTYRIPIWLTASAIAETVGDIALCPFEAVRIRQVSDPKFAPNMFSAISKIHQTEGVKGLYKGLSPIILKQVPYTMSQFVTYELANEYVNRYLKRTRGITKTDLSDGQQLGVILSTGAISGLVASIASHPADTILSKINQEKTDEGVGRAIGNIIRRLGVKGLFLGLQARCVMVTTLVTVQFLIYDGIKLLMKNDKSSSSSPTATKNLNINN
ncbi:mitochondrial substrate carrier family protein [Heterostelium album PN500]|uniref:Mitochondrial substrate carrier family protein n=1 Tax=Heterostelium pallidum (strain ATCC 26659 / Pp 5 / PN500) TaxID=670386 RepID=D3BVF8_HETP5|nr:mitochondrial substrate carrier family protein [Heterostelium album PN500]EFA74581.1 mitochondrial substrate carrier family protein [Heterostelium album PN500]|eukprot:XP_020426715.1 mitochondrial substrate carrier family protein [Heterostelium album PN500]